MVKVVCDGKGGDGDDNDRNRIKTIILFYDKNCVQCVTLRLFFSYLALGSAPFSNKNSSSFISLLDKHAK